MVTRHLSIKPSPNGQLWSVSSRRRGSGRQARSEPRLGREPLWAQGSICLLSRRCDNEDCDSFFLARE